MAPVPGYMESLMCGKVKTSKKGDPLLKIQNIELTKELAWPVLMWLQHNWMWLYRKKLLANEQTRLQVYQQIGTDRVAVAGSNVASLQKMLAVAEKNWQRMKNCMLEHYVTDADFDQAESNVQTLREKLKIAVASMQIEHDALNSVPDGLYFTGNRLEGATKICVPRHSR